MTARPEHFAHRPVPPRAGDNEGRWEHRSGADADARRGNPRGGGQRGDRRAYEQLVTRYQRFVCSLGFAWTGDMALSEELAQDVFVIAWKHLSELRDPNNFSGWLFMIARNRIWRAQRGR